MMYHVKEIFYSLQGEGRNAGRPAVFLRFSGCNLWSGRELDRWRAQCGFCDTNFVGGTRYDSAPSLADDVAGHWKRSRLARRRPLCVLTGGEPALQADEGLVLALHHKGFEVAIETNGTRKLPPGIDWVTLSPKTRRDDETNPMILMVCDELKFVMPQVGLEPELFGFVTATHRYIQPKDGPDLQANTAIAADYCLRHPWWDLSLQVHKIAGLR